LPDAEVIANDAMIPLSYLPYQGDGGVLTSRLGREGGIRILTLILKAAVAVELKGQDEEKA
jgi:hypothetical protein